MPTYTSLNFLEFFTGFPTEESCEEHLINIRWPHGMYCSKCASKEFYHRIRTRRAYQCRSCKSFNYPTAGTIFHRTRTSLQGWFLAIFCVAFDKRGLSALQLAEQIGVNYDTAWGMLQRVRRAMAARDTAYQLEELIEMDDMYLGARAEGTKGRGTDQTPVLVAVSFFADSKEEREYMGFAKMRAVEHVNKHAVLSFARDTVAPGSLIRSDGYKSYASLSQNGFRHESVTIGKRKAHTLMPHVHTYISNLRSFVLGTYHGLDELHLQQYLDEYCYRFNRRKHRQELFDRLLLACLEMTETPFSALTG
jgi:transposase-like protein